MQIYKWTNQANYDFPHEKQNFLYAYKSKIQYINQKTLSHLYHPKKLTNINYCYLE